MAVLSNITVGNIIYYVIDDIPTHSAPKGSISILNSTVYNKSLMYINNDGSSTWLKIITPAYGNIHFNNGVLEVDFDSQTIGSWYPWSSTITYNTGQTLNFSKQNNVSFGDNIRYDGTNLIRVIATQVSTQRGGNSKWLSFQMGPALNFTIPTKYNTFYTFDNNATNNVSASRILQMNPGDSVIPSLSPLSREGGGAAASRGYISKHCSLVVRKVDESLVKPLFSENFESNTFTTNSWTVVNNVENIWVIGQADKSSGTYSAYISNNGGTSQTYNVNNAQVSHFYKDFTFTSNSTITLSFKWKCQGENTVGDAIQYDYGTVVITDTTVTPVAGTEVSTTQATGGGNGRIGATTALGKFNLGYGTTPGTTWNTESINLSGYAGQTKRIVFTWKNDGSVGANPPFSIDDISINEYIW